MACSARLRAAGRSVSAHRAMLAASLLLSSACALSAPPRITPLTHGLQNAGCAYLDLALLRKDEGHALTAQQAKDVAYGATGPFLTIDAQTRDPDSPLASSLARIGINGIEHQLTGLLGSDYYANDSVRVTISDRSSIELSCDSECAGSFVRVKVSILTTSGTQQADALEHCGN